MGTALKKPRDTEHHRGDFIDSDGARLRIRDEGAGPAVMLIHGWALDLDMWAPQFPALEARHRVVAFDRRGFGQSSGFPSIDHDVRDIARLLDTLALPHTALVGMSQGARGALRFALQFPQRVSCLILDGAPSEMTSGPTVASEEVPMTRYRNLARREGFNAFRQAWRRHSFMRLHSGDPGMQALLTTIIDRYPGKDLTVEPATLPAIADRLATVDVPALVINGEHDSPQRHAAGAEFCSLLPRARRAIIPAAGHLPNLDNPAAYNDLVSRFLHEHSACPEPL